ncbi:hypothetical protein [Maribacter halichondriae]|uniref:hypothetical protein n=1 Tax=Maribacter halichondriae TaxID=2980554 RepID=UPI00235A1DE7|nr:hypothetical protein [Maribacter sp. Hal144]
MKTIATLIFVLFIGVAAQAQDNKVETFEKGIVTEITVKEIKTEKNTEVARLYRRKFSTAKKALSFTTKRNAAKMA